MREVIAADGTHYRLRPDNGLIIQEQKFSGAKWRTHSRWVTYDMAAQVLASLGRLIPPAELPAWAKEDGDDAST